MVDPFLHRALHPYFVHPIDVVGSSLVIRRLGDDCVELLIVILQHLIHIVAVHLKPCDELMVEHIVFLKRFTRHVGEGDMDILVVGVHLAAALVSHHEDGLDARGSLRTDTDGTCRGDSQHGDIAATYAAHLLVKVFIQGAQALDEGVVFLALGIVHRELATFFSQVDG